MQGKMAQDVQFNVQRSYSQLSQKAQSNSGELSPNQDLQVISLSAMTKLQLADKALDDSEDQETAKTLYGREDKNKSQIKACDFIPTSKRIHQISGITGSQKTDPDQVNEDLPRESLQKEELPQDTTILKSINPILVDRRPDMKKLAASSGKGGLKQMPIMGITSKKQNQAALEKLKNNPLAGKIRSNKKGGMQLRTQMRASKRATKPA